MIFKHIYILSGCYITFLFLLFHTYIQECIIQYLFHVSLTDYISSNGVFCFTITFFLIDRLWRFFKDFKVVDNLNWLRFFLKSFYLVFKRRKMFWLRYFFLKHFRLFIFDPKLFNLFFFFLWLGLVWILFCWEFCANFTLLLSTNLWIYLCLW